MSALDIQISGRHYKGMAVQPVEFWHQCLMGGSESSTLKYESRWKEKGGLKDLEKGRHFILLVMEDDAYIRLFRRMREAFPLYRGLIPDVEPFLQVNHIAGPQAGVIRYVYNWNRSAQQSDLRAALKWADEAIDSAIRDGW